jgi:hypothetical protein
MQTIATTEAAFGIIDQFVCTVLDGKLNLFDEQVNKFFNFAQDIQFERKVGQVTESSVEKAQMLAELISVTFPS